MHLNFQCLNRNYTVITNITCNKTFNDIQNYRRLKITVFHSRGPMMFNFSDKIRAEHSNIARPLALITWFPIKRLMTAKTVADNCVVRSNAVAPKKVINICQRERVTDCSISTLFFLPFVLLQSCFCRCDPKCCHKLLWNFLLPFHFFLINDTECRYNPRDVIVSWRL